MANIEITASRTNRSLVNTATPDRAPGLRARRIQLANPVLLMFRRAIDFAFSDAKRTQYGLPTDKAICARWWIQEFRPDKTDPALYFGSFEGCCEMLELNADKERSRLLDAIDDVMVKAAVSFASDETYKRRARVLACAGVATAVARQFALGLVAPDDYEDVAGIERSDPPVRTKRVPPKPRGRRLPAHARTRQGLATGGPAQPASA